MTSANAFDGLEPRGLWKHFEAITRIPRPSGQDEPMAKYVCSWAADHGYPAQRDPVGNVCVHVPGRPPFQGAAPIVLQSHLDMVCQRDSSSPYDAARGMIHVLRDGDWLYAEGTTLGADDGIGCAAMLHLAELETAPHAPLDLLFTRDEERGLTGMKNLDPAIVRGRCLLNLDSEDDTMLVVGCAGGRCTTTRWSGRREPIPAGWTPVQVIVSGLRGGHSGLDIDKGRLNALHGLARVLRIAARQLPLRLVRLDGGDKTNAIPRECRAVVCYPSSASASFRKALDQARADLAAQYHGREDGLAISIDKPPPAGTAEAFSEDGTRTVLDLLCSVPSRVIGLSPEMPGLVETSNNLGIVRTCGDEVSIECSARSSNPQALREILDSLHAVANLGGATIEEDDGYPGWKPDMSSRALAVTRQTYQRLFGREPVVTAIHAGLECGLTGERIAGMDMVSLGPEIKGVHAPGERVRISSVERFARLLSEVLSDLSVAVGEV